MISRIPYSGFITSLEKSSALAMENAIKEKKLSMDLDVYENLSHVDDEEIVFFSTQNGKDAISAVGLVKKITSNGFSATINISNIIVFEPVLTLLSFGVDGGWIADLIYKNLSGRRLTHEEWSKFLGWVKLFIRNRKKTRDQFEELFFKSIKQEEKPENLNKLIRLSEQKDAIKLTLDLAGFVGLDNKLLTNADDFRIKKASSILDLFDGFNIQERSMLESDARIVQAFLGKGFVGGTLASSKTTSARVFISDKTPIELALGVDLLIYQPHYHSFILIQYKCLEFGQVTQKWVYRPDSQLISQMTQIDKINRFLNTQQAKNELHRDFRMNSSPFYFKFCERRRGDLDRSVLSPGMTVSFDYLLYHLKQKVGGKRYDYISYEKMPRSMASDFFISLARDGWIGSHNIHTEIISEILQEYDLHGRSGIVAIVDRLGSFDK